uniref:Uncharacterized protein n=1 Tax=Aegilops tauschii subsp. strangulata TaxID=200361 RepID=A0A452ZEQ5_AEGTS
MRVCIKHKKVATHPYYYISLMVSGQCSVAHTRIKTCFHLLYCALCSKCMVSHQEYARLITCHFMLPSFASTLLFQSF